MSSYCFLKMEQFRVYNAVIHLKVADEMADGTDPDQTAAAFQEQSDLGLHYFLRSFYPSSEDFYGCLMII